MGVGNDLKADDAAGLLAIRALKTRLGDSPDILLLEGATAPENFTGTIRRFDPDLVILIDAAHMGEKPGVIRWIEAQEVDGFSASSHVQPLSILAKYLIEDIHTQVLILGIQAGNLEWGEEVSEEVKSAAQEVTEILDIIKNRD